MSKLPSPIFHFVVLPCALAMLFGVEFMLVGAVSVFPESGWLTERENLSAAQLVVALNLKPLFIGAVPSGPVALALGVAFRRMAPEPVKPRSLAMTIVGSWLAVWSACNLALYLEFAGSDPAFWSPAAVTQPIAIYGLVLVGLGLYAGVVHAGSRAQVA